MIRAVIFDMDGLLVDSEPMHFEAYKTILASFGHTLSWELNKTVYIGTSEKNTISDMIRRFSLPLTHGELAKLKDDECDRLRTTMLKAQPGVHELIDALHKDGYPMAIASGSSAKIIKKTIEFLNIDSFINIFCSSDDVLSGKPSPDVYLLASKKLGVKPEVCLALEDAPKGVQAAISAGMKCFAIPSNETLGSDFSIATRVLTSLREVYSLIKTL